MPFMPWQRLVADVAGEIDPDTGLLAYRDVVLTVPRQSGKTSLVLAASVHRALGFGGRQNIVYTAQTRGDARKKWEDDHLPILQGSPFGPLFRPRKTTGNEAFLWRNGSRYGLISATLKSGHGPTVDMAFLDEAFAHTDDRLEQAMRPAMITRASPQLWVLSTAGTRTSTYLRAKITAGREMVTAGRASRTAYFDWSAPDDADPLDPVTWWACMPALGHTITEAAIAAELETMLANPEQGLDLFRRAYLNQWPDEIHEGWRVINRTAWEALADAGSQPGDPVVFAADVTPDRSMGAIGVAGRRGDGAMHVEVVDHRSGTGWMVERLVQLHQRWSPAAVVVDAAGPAGSLIVDLEAAGIEVTRPTARQVAQACGWFYDAATSDLPQLRHLGQVELARALAGATRRPLGEAWAWSRRGGIDICPLVAVTLAAWGRATQTGTTLVPLFARG